MIIGQFDVEFRRDGSLFDQNQVTSLLSGLEKASNLLVLCHGWNNNKAEAQDLYRLFLASLTQLQEELGGGSAPPLAVMQAFWPSKKFEDSDLIPGGGIASANVEDDKRLLDALTSLQEDPYRLGGTDSDPGGTKSLDEAAALIPLLETSEDARREFILHLRNELNPDEAHADDGSVSFFSQDPEELFAEFSAPVPLAPTVGAGGATAMSEGSWAFPGDLLSGFKAAARRLVNYATYYQMKTRAGDVGRIGLASVLSRARAQMPELPLHLVGHSFGGRLITAAASTSTPGGAPITMSLLQAAFSHNALAKKYDGVHDGAFRPLLADNIISGPIIITHTKNDLAVGIAYPLASRFSKDDSSGFGEENDPYGGMGRNGAQSTPEVSWDETEIRQVDSVGPYNFRPGNVYNLNADASIANHGDVTNRPVVRAVLAAMSTGTSSTPN